MTASSMLPVLLPIALFVLTLIIIFILRAGDKRSKSLANVKKLLDIYKGNIEASDNSFKQYASELEQTVAKKDAEVRSLIQTVIAQTNELKSYSEDLLRLKSAMATYQTALDGLAVLTREADDKVQTVQNEVDRLDKIRDVIDGFRQDMKDADEHLRKHESSIQSSSSSASLRTRSRKPAAFPKNSMSPEHLRRCAPPTMCPRWSWPT